VIFPDPVPPCWGTFSRFPTRPPTSLSPFSDSGSVLLSSCLPLTQCFISHLNDESFDYMFLLFFHCWDSSRVYKQSRNLLKHLCPGMEFLDINSTKERVFSSIQFTVHSTIHEDHFVKRKNGGRCPVISTQNAVQEFHFGSWNTSKTNPSKFLQQNLIFIAKLKI
jgi:hypothetical protein